MASHSFVVASNLSIADAFERSIDLERVTEWDDGIASSVRTDDGDDLVGRTFDVEAVGFDGSPTTLVYEITEATAPDRFVMRGTHPMMEAVDTMVFTETETGCSLDYHGTLTLLGNDRPLTDEQLDRAFPKLAAVAERGLTTFLND